MMDPRRFREVDEAFERLLERPACERRSLLEGICRGDTELRRELEELLSADEEARGFLAAPIALSAAPPEDVGRNAGPYELLEALGSGGSAVVYRARRCGEAGEQHVAVKLGRRSASETEAGRLHQEWQILVQFHHPAIARSYDWGITGDGRLYQVMELVDGLALDRWCDGQRLGVSQRLELFHEVCDAVAHAHRHGVVHRDLKPQNVLVTRDGRPKLLDFGIAKLMDPRALTLEPQPSTGSGLRVLTPGYASPEQLEGKRITPASDVYSLGTMLFELLVASSPYRIGGGGTHLLLEITRAVFEQEPLTLGEALERLAGDCELAREVSRSRGTESLDQLHSELTGDLEAVLARTLAKEPEHRYRSAKELAGDLSRYLRGRPVRARRGPLSRLALRVDEIVEKFHLPWH